jgi:thiol-disulfide isomerase/thioredoxin
MKVLIWIYFISIYFITQPFKEGLINTEINFFCKECQGMEVTLLENNLLQNSPRKLNHFIVDSSGFSKIQLIKKDTLNLFLRIGKYGSSTTFLIPLYVEPGKPTDIHIQNKDVTYRGELEKINLYINRIFKLAILRSVYIRENSPKIHQATNLEQELYLEKIKYFGEDVRQSVLEDSSLSEYHKNMLLAFNSSDEITQKMLIENNKYLQMENELKNGVTTELSLSHIFDEFTLNQYLKSNSQYVFLVGKYLEPKFETILNHYFENRDKISLTRYEYIRNIIVRSERFGNSNDLIIALFITLTSFKDGVSYDELLEFTHPFENEFPSSRYLQELREILSEHVHLRSGMPMKDFKMKDITGKWFNLSNLKGSIVYIDVWATWCMPCRKEFKYSVKLAKKYSKRTDLKFLYVSIDRNMDSWTRFLKKNADIKGIHGIQSIDMVSDSTNIMNLYRINGIPRYIIIDKNAKILNYNAPRPSSLVDDNFLDSLLAI